jgi:Tfp pilus assembly protein PilO
MILFSLAGFVYGVVPLVEKSILAQKDIRALDDDITLLKNKAAALQGLDEATLRSNLTTLISAVPPDKSLVTVLSTVDGVAGDSGVTLENLQLANPGSLATQSAKKLTADEAKSGAHILTFSVTVHGSYDQIRGFLSKVASVRRYFHLITLDMSTIGADVEARVGLEAYYTPFPATLGSVTQPLTNFTDKEQKAISDMEAFPVYGTPNSGTVAQQSPIDYGKLDPFSL